MKGLKQEPVIPLSKMSVYPAIVFAPNAKKAFVYIKHLNKMQCPQFSVSILGFFFPFKYLRYSKIGNEQASFHLWNASRS